MEGEEVSFVTEKSNMFCLSLQGFNLFFLYSSTLAQYLTKLDREMEEKEILKMFYEMTLALQCIHQHKILHR
jgi:serine/threonine protein kinase